MPGREDGMSIAPPHVAEAPDADISETGPLPSWVIPPAEGFIDIDLGEIDEL